MLSGNGINCERETAHANKLAGFDTDIVHINSLLDGTKNIHDYHFLNFPGGFLDGDDLGAAKAQAVTLTFNDSGRFQDRWVYLKICPFSTCIFTQDMDRIYLPVRHGEGKLVAKSVETLQHLPEEGEGSQIFRNAHRYVVNNL